MGNHHEDRPIRPLPRRETTGLVLVFSEEFSPNDAELVRTRLGDHLEVDEPIFTARFSADPNLVSVIRVIGDVATWLPLSAPVAVYLSTIAKRAGDATWNSMQSLFKRKEVKPLADVATTLAETASRVDGEVYILIGLDIPDDYWGTCISIRGRDPEEIAHKMAAFLIHIEELSTVMRAEVEAGHAPLGGATVEVQSDGSLKVKWRTVANFKEYERVIP